MQKQPTAWCLCTCYGFCGVLNFECAFSFPVLRVDFWLAFMAECFGPRPGTSPDRFPLMHGALTKDVHRC